MFTFPTIDLSGAFETMVTGVSGQVTAILPIGVGLILIMAVPRVIRRVIGAFV